MINKIFKWMNSVTDKIANYRDKQKNMYKNKLKQK